MNVETFERHGSTADAAARDTAIRILVPVHREELNAKWTDFIFRVAAPGTAVGIQADGSNSIPFGCAPISYIP